jgi:signal transduction histidine kinase
VNQRRRKDPREVIEEIERSFGATTYPGDDKIVYDQSGGHLECAEVGAAFRGKRWQELSSSLLAREESALAFFTPEAFLYYLPAYLRATLQHREEMDLVLTNVVSRLTLRRAEDVEGVLRDLAALPLESEAREAAEGALADQMASADERAREFLELMSGFTPEQANAIRSFLEQLADDAADPEVAADAVRALDRFWAVGA